MYFWRSYITYNIKYRAVIQLYNHTVYIKLICNSFKFIPIKLFFS